eukprot:2730498-Prymnesium_polylepis.1
MERYALPTGEHAPAPHSRRRTYTYHTSTDPHQGWVSVPFRSGTFRSVPVGPAAPCRSTPSHNNHVQYAFS